MRKALLIAIILAAALLVFASMYVVWMPQNNESGVQGEARKITYENFAEEVSKQSLVRDLPKEAAIQLKFYTFEGDDRKIVKSYILKAQNVEEGQLDDSDMTILLHSQYINELTSSNFCTIVAKAKQNGDLAVESELSSVALAWKYRSMTKYKKCLGL